MNVIKSLTSRREFSHVYNNGASVVDRLLVFYTLPNNRQYARFGFSVGKKLGNAVIRNRFKRILREICRINSYRFKSGYDCIIIARPRITAENYRTIEKSFLKLAGKAGVIGKELNQNEESGNNRHKVLSKSNISSNTQ